MFMDIDFTIGHFPIVTIISMVFFMLYQFTSIIVLVKKFLSNSYKDDKSMRLFIILHLVYCFLFISMFINTDYFLQLMILLALAPIINIIMIQFLNEEKSLFS